MSGASTFENNLQVDEVELVTRTGFDAIDLSIKTAAHKDETFRTLDRGTVDHVHYSVIRPGKLATEAERTPNKIDKALLGPFDRD